MLGTSILEINTTGGIKVIKMLQSIVGEKQGSLGGGVPYCLGRWGSDRGGPGGMWAGTAACVPSCELRLGENYDTTFGFLEAACGSEGQNESISFSLL